MCDLLQSPALLNVNLDVIIQTKTTPGILKDLSAYELQNIFILFGKYFC